MQGIPKGLMIMQSDIGYITIHDMLDGDGNPMQEKGIDLYQDALSEDDREGFERAVADKTNGRKLADIVGHALIAQTGRPNVPQRPSLCVFCLEADGDWYVARGMAQMVTLLPTAFGLYVFEDGELLQNARDNWGGTIRQSDLNDPSLRPVFSAVTITEEMQRDGGFADGSADYGDFGT